MRFATHGSPRRHRAVGIAVAAAMLGGGVTGCGAEENLTPGEAVARATEKAADVTSLRYRVTGTLPEHGKVRAEASMGVRPSVMSMELTGLGDTEDRPVEIRFVGGAMYVQGDTSVLGDTDGKRWIEAGPAVWGSGTADNQSYGVVPRQMQGSPLLQSMILSGADDVKKTGTETVDGTGTTHYRGTVTTKELRTAQGAAKDKETRERLTTGLDQLLGLGLRFGSALTMDLWVDGDDRAKQFRMRGKTSSLNGKGRTVDTGPLDMTVTFLDVDPSVTVEPPAADDTVDAGALADEAGVS
ncbi:hypothetical protein [Streptomyces adelaidensis]|uniref:hypothetical protein n=1 Tax=Streptomyces adelaidensis TaxID=2796465 RepID=UPI001F48F0B5|nr:hypothetical protein [Streptomyces adelaidensis]